MGLRLFLLLLILSTRTGWTQSSAPPTLHVDSQLVLLDALVQNKKTGLPVAGLSEKDFRLTEDGGPQTVTYCSRDELPLSIVLLFDMTETVHAALGNLAKAGLEVLGHLKPQDQVAVMIFSSRTELLQGFTANRRLAADAIKTASWMADVEGTFLDQDMFEAIDQAMKAQPGSRRVLVWLTDGTANQENAFTRATIGQHAAGRLHTQGESLMKLLRSGVAVSALIDRTAETNRAIMNSAINGTRLGDIDRYARATGGPVLNTDSQGAASRLALLIDQLRSRYTLGYKPARNEPAGKFTKIELQLAPDFLRDRPELRKQGVTVLTRSGYYR